MIAYPEPRHLISQNDWARLRAALLALEEISLTPKGNAAIFMVVFIANGPKRTGKTPFTF